MADAARIRRFEPGDLPAYVDLYRRVFGRTIDGRFLAWKHRCDLSDRGNPPLIFLAVDGGGAILGANSFFATELADAGLARRVVQSGDTMVADAARGRGVFTGIISHALPVLGAAGHEAVFGWANRNSLPGLLKTGFSTPCRVHALRKPLRWGHFAARKAHAAAPVARALESLDEVRLLALRPRLAARASSLDDPQFVALAARAGEGRLHQRRSDAYFDQKYRLKSVDSYEVALVTDGVTPRAAAVVRRDEPTGSEGTVVEWFADPGIGHSALAALFAHCRGRGFDHLVIWRTSTRPAWGAALERAPFRLLPAWRDREFFFEQSVGLAFIVNTLGRGLDHLHDHRRWYFTAGDADTA